MKLFYDGREWDTKSAKNSNELKLPTDKDTTCLKAFEARLRLDANFFAKYSCGTFRCYLIISV
jgi:hypothetical protein